MNREELYRIWKVEKSEITLQRLNPSFYAEIRKLLSDCMAALADSGIAIVTTRARVPIFFIGVSLRALAFVRRTG